MSDVVARWMPLIIEHRIRDSLLAECSGIEKLQIKPEAPRKVLLPGF
jgi:hypothetical protein